MGSVEPGKQQISALADGELSDDDARTVIDALRAPDGRSDWDLYHQIGDVLRSEALAAPLSAGFADRFSARLASEPPLLAPRSRLRERWSSPRYVAAAVMAAALTGFVIAPHLMQGEAGGHSSLTEVAKAVSDSPVAGTSDITLSQAPVYAVSDYIRIHHSSHPSLYGTAQLARPVDLSSKSDR